MAKQKPIKKFKSTQQQLIKHKIKNFNSIEFQSVYPGIVFEKR
jgi:hypothetical protein